MFEGSFLIIEALSVDWKGPSFWGKAEVEIQMMEESFRWQNMPLREQRCDKQKGL